MAVLVGTSGWQYPHRRGRFYPRGLRQREELSWYASRFRTVEVNATFYRLPEPETFARWRRETPDDFVFALKASRYLTHVRRLRDPRDPVHRLVRRARLLGPKLGPILLQLPPDLRRDGERLERALDAFPAGLRVAVEPRHASWFEEGVRALLAERGAALCLADRGSRWVTPRWRTAPWAYVRLHEGRATPSPAYGPRALRSRARALAEGWGPRVQAYVYFNNDAGCRAPLDAAAFAREAGRAGLRPSRTPRP